MKLILLTACLLFCTLPPSEAADLFASPTPKTDPWAVVKGYKTSAAFFDATRSGVVPELIINEPSLLTTYCVDELEDPLVEIFNSQRGVPAIGRGTAVSVAYLLVIITRYEAADEKGKVELDKQYKSTRSNNFKEPNQAKFIGPIDSFLKDYARAVREYFASKKEREEQLVTAEAERQRLADMASQKAQDERWQAMAAASAKANANAASIQAEQELRRAAIMGAIAAQEKVREQKLQEALASPAYKIWQVALQVEEGVKLVGEAKRILDKDDAIQRESGVTDLAMRRTAGERIVAGKSLVQQAFATYKRLGGNAREPEDVKAGEDPAREYR